MKRIHGLPVLLLAAFAAAPAAMAQNGLGNISDQARMASKNFDIADRNHDGLLSRDEANRGPVPFIRNHFDAIDTAGKGQISKQDVAAYLGTMNGGRRPPPATSTPPPVAR